MQVKGTDNGRPTPDGTADQAPPRSPDRDGAGGSESRIARAWAWLIPAALLAGAGAWLAGEQSLLAFRMSPEEAAGGAPGFGGQVSDEFLQAKRRVAIRNSALHYAILGVAVGGVLGLAAGLSRRSAGGAVVGLGVGVLAGGAIGGLASLGLVPVFLANYSQDRPDLLLPLVTRGGVCAAIGLVAGGAVGVGRGMRPSGLASAGLGGAIGAVAGAVTFEVVYAVAYPLARSETPIPDGETPRLIAFLVVALAVALGTARAIGASGGRRRSG